MPNDPFNHVLRYAAENRFLALNHQGDVVIAREAPAPVAKRLKEGMKVDGNNRVIIQAWDERNSNANDPGMREQRRAIAARREAARQVIKAEWEKLGGAKSVLGLPKGNDIEIIPNGEGYVSNFRSGTIHINSNGTSPVVAEYRSVGITFLGLECIVRQETADELFGVVGVYSGANNLLALKRFPASGTITMGPDNMRLKSLSMDLLEGTSPIRPIENLHLFASLVENDSGDVDVIAKNITDKVASGIAQGLGAATGTSGEAIADSESFKENLATGFAWIFGDILGMGDDPYDIQTIPIFWEDLVGEIPTIGTAERSDTPGIKIGPYTHRIELTGRDGGGDVGKYAFMFKLETHHFTDASNG